VAGIARALATDEAWRGDRAVLACAQPLGFLAALLALWSLGRAALVPASLQPEAIAAAAAGGAPVLLDEAMAAMPPAAHDRLALPPAAQCRLGLYTSGSTGEPKRVDKTLRQLDREIENLQQQWGAALARACVLATVPHHHIYGLLFRLLWPLAAGRPADDAACVDPQHLRELAARRGPHVLVSTPAHLSRFPELLALRDWRRPEIIFSSGGPLAPATAALYRDAFGAAPAEVFGSTETGGVAWRQRDGSPADEAWTPFPGIGVGTDADGALLLDSVYLDQPRWRMDDAAELLPGGRFVLRGRLDRVVKVEGKRLSLPELESRLQAHAGVGTACAVVLPPPQRLGAVIVPTPAGREILRRDGARKFARALRRHLSGAFDAVLLPKRFRFVDRLPVSERGKLATGELQRLFSDESQGDA
jgi:acyl-coenzyme A synthetase/AMP-(fatty) acid ligase